MSSAVSITAASTVCCHGADRPARTPSRQSPQVVELGGVAGELGRPGVRGVGQRAGPARRRARAVLGCGSGWPSRAHGYLSTAARTAAVRSSPVPPGPCRSIVVTMRKLCALPSNPSGSPSRSRASRSSTCSPRCPNGGCPRSWASAAASTTSASQPPRRVARWPRWPASALIRSAMARATWATCRLCVSRLCTISPAPVGLTTWVTPASRAKNGEAAIRSRSTRNGLLGQARPGLLHPGPPRGPQRLIDHSRDPKPCPWTDRVERAGDPGRARGRRRTSRSGARRGDRRRGLRTLLLDPAPDAPWRHTYGSWAAELPPELPPAVVAARARGRAIARTEHRLGWDYAVLDVPALRAHLDAGLAAAGVTVRAGRVVGPAGPGAVALAGGRRAAGPPGGGRRRCRDSRSASSFRRASAVPAEQAAYGVIVRRPRWPPRWSQPGTALFMDWRPRPRRAGPADVPLRGPARRGRGAAGGDLAGPAGPACPMPVLRRRLLARLARHGVTPPAEAPDERVLFPLDTPRHRARGVLGFGAAAPLVHPASGFSLATALSLAPAVAHALATRLPHGVPRRAGRGRPVVWPAAARAVHRFRRIGLEALLRMPPAPGAGVLRGVLRAARAAPLGLPHRSRRPARHRRPTMDALFGPGGLGAARPAGHPGAARPGAARRSGLRSGGRQ